MSSFRESLMPDDNKTSNYERLLCSVRKAGENSILVGPADPQQEVSFTIMVRRNPDGPPLPDFSYWQNTHPARRKKYSVDQFAQFYGATKADLDAVTQFLTAAGMTVVRTHAASRIVVGKATVAQLNTAFSVVLQRYDSPAPRTRRDRTPERPHSTLRQIHNSYEGYLHVPQPLANVIVGIFGLDNRKVTRRNASPEREADYRVTAAQVCQLYSWPMRPIPNQTIGILSGDGQGFDPTDITLYFQNLNMSLYSVGTQGQESTGFFVQGNEAVTASATAQTPPAGAVVGNLAAPNITVYPTSIGGVPTGLLANNGISSGETNMDISLASTVAQGAAIVVYIFPGDAPGWIDALTAAIYPGTNQPVPNVLTCSFFMSDGDDPHGLDGWTDAEINNVSAMFQDAAGLNLTVCIASGDHGTDSFVNDGYAHVQYPGSDVNVLSCGGTSLGKINKQNTKFEEWVWNDSTGATGGGVSAFFGLPSYQASTGIPPSLNPSNAFTPNILTSGRGVPDVAANASGRSSYPLFLNGTWWPDAGTSAAAPLIAGLIAQANAFLGFNVGFLNPILYATNGMACRRVTGGTPLGFGFTPPPSPAHNAYYGVTGYSAAGSGWNPCTGWGVFDWDGLINALTKTKEKEKESKETKEAAKEIKEAKEKESPEAPKDYVDKISWTKQETGVDKHESYKLEFGESTGIPGSHSDRLLHTILNTQASFAAKLAKGIGQLAHEVQELRAFIRPEERPPAGEQALARSAKDAKLGGTESEKR
jgi:kumamolisin